MIVIVTKTFMIFIKTTELHIPRTGIDLVFLGSRLASLVL